MLKIAFLFLTMANLHHEAYWQDFFKGHTDKHSVYVYTENDLQALFKHCKISGNSPAMITNHTAPLVTTLQQALVDPDNEKFVILSDATIPLQDFDTVYTALMNNEKSIACPSPAPYTPINTSDIDCDPNPVKTVCENLQLLVLNRQHARLLAYDQAYLPLIVTHYYPGQPFYSTVVSATDGLFEDAQQQDIIFTTMEKDKKSTIVDCAQQDTAPLLKKAQEQNFLFFANIDPRCKNICLIDALLPYKIQVSPPHDIEGRQEPDTTLPTESNITFLDARDAIPLFN